MCLTCFSSATAPTTLPELNRRLRNIPRVRDPDRRGMDYRTFTKGLTGWGKWSADDHVALMQQMVFAVGTDNKVIKAGPAVRKAFIGAVDTTQLIYRLAKQRESSEYDLNRLHEAATSLGPLLKKAASGLPVKVRSKLNLNRPKVHAPVHYRYFIRRYGSGLNFDTATEESFHKVVSCVAWAVCVCCVLCTNLCVLTGVITYV